MHRVVQAVSESLHVLVEQPFLTVMLTLDGEEGAGALWRVLPSPKPCSSHGNCASAREKGCTGPVCRRPVTVMHVATLPQDIQQKMLDYLQIQHATAKEGWILP